ncbi:MAG: hypothetical protein PUP92_16475 [Rhizonema sp. PD38]|nr:hypothetical protein [Rhizonema sp. PD38]
MEVQTDSFKHTFSRDAIASAFISDTIVRPVYYRIIERRGKIWAFNPHSALQKVA